MSKLCAIWLLAALALPARADIVDSGALQIGGQGIIGGTMTVQGSAFSVGGATFVVTGSSVGIRTGAPAAALDVAGSAQFGSGVLKSTFAATPAAGTYALTLSSGAKLSNGGPIELTSGGYIKWPDGTTSTTASAGGIGNAILAATQAFSGQNTFAGTLVVGKSSYTMAADYNSTIVGGCSVVASTNPAGDPGSWTFTSLRSTGTYELRISGIMGAGSSFWSAIINSDSGANYKSYTVNPNGNASTTTSLLLSLTSGVGLYPANGTPYVSRLQFGMPNGRTSNYVSSMGEYYYEDQNGTNDPGTFGGNWAGSAPMTSITISNSNKAFTGALTLLYCATANGPF